MYDTYTEPLRRLIEKVQPKNGLEIGYGYGLSSGVYLSTCPGKLLSVDLKDWYGVGNRHEASPNFSVVWEDSKTYLPKLAKEGRKFDYIYIDGDHSYEGAYADIKNSIPLLTKKGILVLDDYGTPHGAFAGPNEGDTGAYGVEKATKELLKGWKRVYADIELANGGRVYTR